MMYRLLHRDYPESFAAYTPQMKDFYDVVQFKLPENWTIERREMWFCCSPAAHKLPWQGWKIHVSATSSNAPEMLEKVACVLFRHTNVAFKFVADQPLLTFLNSKNWPRASSGKFITIYPADSRHFVELIEEINEATAGMHGPYILSDHRYKNSRAVFYRYGGIRVRTDLNVKGERVPVLKTPEGALVPDQRLAYPVIPVWEKPVLPIDGENNQHKKEENPILLHGRYSIEKALTFSSAGGVYYGRDTHSGQRVIIKEARPCINAVSDDYDAIDLLKKEYRLLTVVAQDGIAPQPLNLFQEWEHWFLVEEFIEGTEISRHSAAHNILLRTRATTQEHQEWRVLFARICADLIRILKILHSHSIVFADLSVNNLMLTASGELKIIDFEGAYEPGIDRPANIYTPGFVSQQRIKGGQAGWDDDYYSAGAVLLAYLLPINGLLHLNPRARQEFLSSIQHDIDLPADITSLINRLMNEPESSAERAADEVESRQSPLPKARTSEPSNDCYQNVVDGIVKHLNGIAEYERKDRLYPSDPRVFSTNPLSLAYGAMGVAYALHKITGTVPQPILHWILKQKISASQYPPGLYVGMSGIAWTLLEIGLREHAERAFQSTFGHRLVYSAPDLFHGVAGWGMTALKFFHETGREVYLDKAREAGNRLLQSCKRSERGYQWSKAGECPIGMAHGSSGISLFLLYLYMTTGDERYLATGLQGLEFDLAAGVKTKDGGLSWGESVDSPSPLYPYWRFGSSGIGMVTARYERLTGASRYRTILEQIFIDTDRKYAVLPGFFTGLTGLGEFLLDMYELRGEQRFLNSANRVAEGILHFRVERNGIAFPGEMLSRLCCDYGTGSAGIALFFNRLLKQQKSNFLLDEFFTPLFQEDSTVKYRGEYVTLSSAA